MRNSIMKTFGAIAILLLSSSTYAYDNSNNFGNYENFDCCQEDCCYTCPPCSGKGFIGAEFLYWRAYENGLENCVPTEITNIVDADGTVISTFIGKGEDPHFKWNPGFRVGLGYEFGSCGFGLLATWTHLHSNSHHSINDENEVCWNIKFDVIDVMAGYKYDLGSCFALTPFFGLRGAKIDQKFHLDQTTLVTIPPNDLISIDRDNKQKFWGIGPLLGIGADVNMRSGFSLYANTSISWLYGNFDITLDESEVFVDSVNNFNIEQDLDACIGAFDAAIGIRWQTCVCKMQLFLQVGLEHHRYFDYNRIGEYGDLSFDGVNLSVGLGF